MRYASAGSRVRKMSRLRTGLPEKQGLYDPANEHDSCGVGFVANIKGVKSHEIIAQGLQLLINLDHRGAVGADPTVGYAVGMCFLPREARARDIVVKQFEHFIRVEGQTLVGWRDVPVDTAGLGKT